MRALILNSVLNYRIGELTSEQPKCLTQISVTDTILSRQLRFIASAGITEVVITTGNFCEALTNYCDNLELPIRYSFVNNSDDEKNKYIYSIYSARQRLMDDDILIICGDVVFEQSVFDDFLESRDSCINLSSTIRLLEKDLMGIVHNEYLGKAGIQFFIDNVEEIALFKLNKKDWMECLDKIIEYCESVEYSNNIRYAEDTFNYISNKCKIRAIDVNDRLCMKIKTPEDLAVVKEKLAENEKRTVYMCFSTDIIHSAHIAIIKKAAKLGKLIVGILTDEMVISYKRFPIVPCAERIALFQNISGVYKVVEQNSMSYKRNLEIFHPTYVVHGDDWKSGFQKPIRDEVVSILASYGGILIEVPYSYDAKYEEMDNRVRLELSLPDIRRGRLKKAIKLKGLVNAIEAHSGITGLIAEKTVVHEDGKSYQFDAMWISSLCDSTAKGKPDIELVDMTSRFRTVDDIMEVTTKPIIFDGDTGGLTEHFVYTVKSLERIGVSMIIIEDKTGLKKNSLFGTEVSQTQDTIENFSAKIAAGKKAQKTKDFMICARIESLILERGMNDALERAFAFVNAGADAIMIHSRKKDPTEIFEFVEKFRLQDMETPVVVVPTSFNSVTEDEFKKRGVNIVIYANQLTRSGFPAMQNAAKMILQNHRAQECDATLMSIKDIITLIPEE